MKASARATAACARVSRGLAWTWIETMRRAEWVARALAETPDDPRALSARADVYVRTGRFAEAAADLERAAEIYRSQSLDAHELNCLLALAQVQLALNDLDAAEATAALLTE